MKFPVNIIRRKGQAALVEFKDKGELKRVTVPAVLADNSEISKENLNEGIPYGINWSEFKPEKFDPIAFDHAMKEGGIWTLADLESNPAKVYNIIQKYLKITVDALALFARTKEKPDKEQ